MSRREIRRPKQASLRRAISAAYYAVFHLIHAEAADILAAKLSPGRKAGIQRWFSHSETKKVCQIFLASGFPKPASLAGLELSPALRVVAQNFARLQEAGHKADYDLSTSWTRLSALQQVNLANDVLAAWQTPRGTEEANIFILALVLWKKVLWKNFEMDG